MRTCLVMVSGGRFLNFDGSREGEGCLLETGTLSVCLFVCVFVGQLVTLSGIFELSKITLS